MKMRTLFGATTAALCLLASVIGADANRDFFEIRQNLRRVNAHTTKADVARYDEGKPVPFQLQNPDEERYADLRGSYGKALRRLPGGLIDPLAFQSLVYAMQTSDPEAFLRIILGDGTVRLVSPQSSFCYSLAANDGWINAMPPVPQFASAETAGEMVEVYWTALVRDVPFNEFGTDATVMAAVANLNTLSDFKGPKVGGAVTTGTFLRGNAPGELDGPYISQFLYQTVPYGSTTLPPEQTVPQPGFANDFVTTFADWLIVESGGVTGATIAFDPMQQILRTPRDLAEYVHVDTPLQESFNAARILLSYGDAALDPANPYLNNPTQEGFVTFGEAGIISLVAQAVQDGLQAAWYQKWEVNRRLRPEEFGYFVDQTVGAGQDFGINPQLLNSPVLPAIFGTFGSYFLPLAYPEGSPAHPSYPAGHATFIGAAVTILKAVFNENFAIPSPLQPNGANTALEPYVGPPTLTVGGELNKLASNVALGRDHAGVHYRSDGWQGMLLGEQVAIDLLNNTAFLFNEPFAGYTLTKFDGTTITVGSGPR